MTFEDIKKRFDYYCAHPEHWNFNFEGPMIGILTKMCGTTEHRQQFQETLTGCRHYPEMGRPQRYAMYKLVQPDADESGQWASKNPNLEEIIRLVLEHGCQTTDPTDQ